MALLKKLNHIWSGLRNIHLNNAVNSKRSLKDINLESRVKASTLMETLVATVLIVVIFMISSMVLNNLLKGSIRQNTELAQERLNALEYQYKNDGLALPYFEDFESWEISVAKAGKEELSLIVLEAANTQTDKTVTNYIQGED